MASLKGCKGGVSCARRGRGRRRSAGRKRRGFMKGPPSRGSIAVILAWIGGQAQKTKALGFNPGPFHKNTSRRRPTLPHTNACSTIGAEGLNCRVRNGNGCFPLATATGKFKLKRTKSLST